MPYRVRWTTLALVVGALALATPASAASPSFSSSFEPSDPQPAWTDTAERAQGVTGPARPGIPGNVTDTVVAMKASGENANSGEVKENLVDGSADSKWLVFERTGWVELELAEPVTIVRYALTSANDAPARDPRDWTLQGSDDGQTWKTLDTQTGQTFDARFQTKTYDFANGTAYKHYRLDITSNSGATIVQLAELQLSTGQENPPPAPVMRSIVGSGPRGGYNAKAGAGFTGLRALRYGGRTPRRAAPTPTTRSSTSTSRSRRATELSYVIYPDFERDDLGYPSTYAAVDLAFTDGTYLSDLHAVDQHGAELSPRGQGASKTLYTNQWNAKRSRIGAVAAGKTIDRILVAYDNPPGTHDFGGWIDDLDLGPPGPRPRARAPSDWVVTTRGTNSSGSFSRGNNIPATAVPHGFNFWTPVTNAATTSWLYEYQRDNNADNLPTLEAFAASHEPSPWMGDRQTFQVMPSRRRHAGRDRSARALAFRHANEIAKPHYYGVTFENGIKTEIAPTDHAAMFRFTFPGDRSNLIFDNVNSSAADDDRPGGRRRDGLVRRPQRPLQRRHAHVHVRDVRQADRRRAGAATTAGPNGLRTFDARTREDADRHVADQRRAGAAQPRARDRAGDTVESVKDRAQGQWDAKLGVIEVEGATEDQLTTLYSNLYRLYLYPNSAFENTGTTSAPRLPARRAVLDRRRSPSTPTQTGAPGRGRQGLRQQRVLGHLPDDVVGLLAAQPERRRRAGRRLRAAVPRRRLGRALVVAGLREPDDGHELGRRVRRRLREGRRAASTPRTPTTRRSRTRPSRRRADPNDSNVGRKGLVQSLFLGYTPSRVAEGVSWALEGDINDFGIANMAEHARRRPRRTRRRSAATRRSASTSAAARRTT